MTFCDKCHIIQLEISSVSRSWGVELLGKEGFSWKTHIHIVLNIINVEFKIHIYPLT